MGLIENVCGILFREAGSSKSGLDFVMDRLEASGYEVTFLDLDLASWHEATRRRTAEA